MTFLFWSYLSHFKSDFDCVKSKVGLGKPSKKNYVDRETVPKEGRG